MSRNRIYLSPPHLTGEEISYIREALESNWVAPLGPNIDAFEQEFCATVGAANAVAVSSGTAALHLAIRLLKVQADDEIMCSTLTFAASANPILYERARPVFIDSERESWNMDPNLLETALKARAIKGRLPKAVVLVHLYGQSADLDAIAGLCDQYEVPLIEDAAEALGATYKGVSPGVRGRFGIYSFNGNKIITTSGGGMLVCADRALAERARFLASQARDSAPHYQHSEIGFNYRMSNILAGIGRAQLKVLSMRVAARRANFELYRSALQDLPEIEFMPEAPWGTATRWLSCVLIHAGKGASGREAVRLALGDENIEARPIWKPMHLQPLFSKYEVFNNGVSEELFVRGLCLPSGSFLTLMDLKLVASVIRRSILQLSA